MPLLSFQTILAKRPLGLVFDIDGTLSPYVSFPYIAQLYEGVVPLLEQAREHAHIGILTSRGIDDAAALVNLDEITYFGTYGLECSNGLPWLHPVQIMTEALTYVEPGKRLLDLVEQRLSGLSGIIVERKRIGGTVHYRHCPDPEGARQLILSLLKEPAQQLNMRLVEGERVVEVRAPEGEDKGRALQRFVRHFGLRGVIFAGDDIPDLEAFLEIAKLKQEGIAALSIVVRHVNTSAELLEHADVVVQEVEGMVELLREMVESL
jgi:trehalose 6-phosphate phosphatase